MSQWSLYKAADSSVPLNKQSPPPSTTSNPDRMSIIPLTETVVQLAKNINLYSSVAKSQIAAEAMTYVGEVLKANMLHVTQELSLQSNPAGFVLM